MCPVCHRFICAEGCPGDNGESTERGKVAYHCAKCGLPIWRGEEFYSVRTKPYCNDCLSVADTDELAAFFGCRREDFYFALGAVHRRA